MYLRRFVVAAAATALTTVLSFAGLGGVASAATSSGCTTVQQNSGIVCATVKATSPQSIESFGGYFAVGTTVVRPRLVAELLNYDGSVASVVEQEWDNDRIKETINKDVNESSETRYSRVCTTLYEAGEKLDTACVPVPSRP